MWWVKAAETGRSVKERTVRMGAEARYLASRRGVRPVLVKATMRGAPSFVVARTADDASASVCSHARVLDKCRQRHQL